MRTHIPVPLTASPSQWEAFVLKAADDKNFVDWPMIPVPCGEPDTYFYASRLPFAIGDRGDYVFAPLGGIAAQKLADKLGALLPTVRMVELIRKEAERDGKVIKPITMPADGQMRSVPRIVAHSEKLAEEIEAQDPTDGLLVDGLKKYVVLSAKMRHQPGRLAFFGWYGLDGEPIQRLNLAPHDDTYFDYSHGVMLVAPMMVVRGEQMKVVDVLADPALCHLVSGEGVLSGVRYGSMPTIFPTIRLGSKGENVKAWQQFFQTMPVPGPWSNDKGVKRSWPAGWQWPPKPDGDFGERTEAATEAWQHQAGLTADGVVGPATQRAWRAACSASDSVPPPPVTVTKLPPASEIRFVKAKHFRASRPTNVTLFVVHTIESAESATSAEGCANYFTNPMQKGKDGQLRPVTASAHYTIDSDSVIQCVRDEHTAWHTGGKLGGVYINDFSLGFEHGGRAGQTSEQWKDAYSTQMLRLSAQLLARKCVEHGVRPVFLDVADLRAGATNGITGHWQCVQASGSGNHTDPGEWFPWDAYIGWVQEEYAKLQGSR